MQLFQSRNSFNIFKNAAKDFHISSKGNQQECVKILVTALSSLMPTFVLERLKIAEYCKKLTGKMWVTCFL